MTEDRVPFAGPVSVPQGKTDLSALVARLEQAAGPDRALDADICRLLIPFDDCAAAHGYRFTSSIDAALTLVPEGWRFSSVSQAGNEDAPPLEKFYAVLARIDEEKYVSAPGATEPLARTSAALRAILADKENSQ